MPNLNQTVIIILRLFSYQLFHSLEIWRILKIFPFALHRLVSLPLQFDIRVSAYRGVVGESLKRVVALTRGWLSLSRN